ncbi:hypothetical protein [Streptomyces sp. NPDC001401]|uniref:hypothetical protein n=1 Tax=Streptomyces sp. NPDC001401 TaxID=3364570 RepID=UPI0036B9B92A
MESAEPPEEEVRPLEPDELEELSELLDELSEPDELAELLDDVSVPALELELLLVPVLLLAAELASACIVPIRANTPATPASVTAAAKAAVRRAPLRTAAAAPRSSSLVVMTVPLPQ